MRKAKPILTFFYQLKFPRKCSNYSLLSFIPFPMLTLLFHSLRSVFLSFLSPPPTFLLLSTNDYWGRETRRCGPSVPTVSSTHFQDRLSIPGMALSCCPAVYGIGSFLVLQVSQGKCPLQDSAKPMIFKEFPKSLHLKRLSFCKEKIALGSWD